MRPRRISFSDFLFLVCIGLMLASLLSMQIPQYRAAARKSGCVSNLFQLVLATHNYHSAFKQLPMGCGGTTAAPHSELWQSNQDRLSAFVALTPFHEETALWEQITKPQKNGGITFPSMGPAPWYDPAVYSAWSKRPSILACPADSDSSEFSTVSSYVMNYGDAVHLVGEPFDPNDKNVVDMINASSRGLFVGKQVLKFRSVLDGLSNTVMFSESCIASRAVAKNIAGMSLAPSRCIAAHRDPATEYWPRGREACWADGCLRSSGFQTILPPNSPSATSSDSELWGIMSASSHHRGGVHIAMADGAIKFVTNTIDAGDKNAPTVARLPGTKHAKPKSKSSYGLWGAIGTRASMEVIQRDDSSLQTPPLSLTENELAAIKRKPVQTWTLSETGSKIRGQTIAVVDKALIYWSANDNDVQQIPLAKLIDNDAEQVQSYYDKVLDRALLQLKVQITKANRMLENNQAAAFCDAMIESDSLNREQLGTLVKENRGSFVKILEELVDGINHLESRVFIRRMSREGPFTIRLSKLSRLKDHDFVIRFVDGRWSIQVN